jgi:hypothetical protein
MEDATEFLMVRAWTGDAYGGITDTGTVMPITTGYYCRNHMAEKLDSLTRRYRSGSRDDDNNNTSTGTGPDVNLAATSPKRSC